MNPLRSLLDLHPPWAHWSFWLVWAITASIGPIGVIAGLIDGSSTWLIGLGICGIALVTIGVDWLIVRRLRRRNPEWTPWVPPGWLNV